MISLPGTGSTALALLLAAAATGSACAMNPTSTEGLSCVVQGADELPPELGGGEAVCSAIERASVPALQRAGVAPAAVSVLVTVRSPYRISAVPSVNGSSLAEQHVGIADRPLNQRALDMLAQSVAAELAKVPQP